MNKISHGFGDIISSAFLRGYTEPVLTILHSNPHRFGGRACPGRLGHRIASTRTPLCLTAISVSIVQKRSVVLWSLPDVIPSDAFQLYPHPKGGVIVVGVNELLYVDCSGIVQCCTAVNGWVRSTGSAVLLPKVGTLGGIMQPNPSPLTKLSVQLDGCRLSFVNENVAMLSLRDGSLYSLELHEKGDCIGVGGGDGVCMSLSPVGNKLGGLGMISTLSALPLVHIQTMGKAFNKFLDEGSVNPKKEQVEDDNEDADADADAVKEGKTMNDNDTASSLGLIFAGSRMGDSTLMVYGLKEKMKLVPLERDREQEKAIADALEMSEQKSKRKREEDEDDGDVAVKKEKLDGNNESTSTPDAGVKAEEKEDEVIVVSDDETNLSEEEILRLEEEALYAPETDDEGVNAIAPLYGDESERNETLLPGISAKQLYRPQIRSMSVFQHTKVLDCLTGLGPIGPGCAGPLAAKESTDAASVLSNMTRPAVGSVANVHPCGFGSSGGLAVLTTPGLHAGSTVVSETDCLNIGAIFPCPNLGYFFVVKKEENAGCIIMKVADGEVERRLEEVELDSILEGDMDEETPIPSFASARDVLTRMTTVSVKEFTSNDKSAKGNFVMLMVRYGSAYALVILSQQYGKFSIEHSHFIGALDDGNLIERENLVSASFVEHLDQSRFLSAGEDLSLACVWSSGHASTFSISYDGSWVVRELLFSKTVDQESMDCEAPDNDDDEANKFYQDGSIVAIDIFAVADNIFEKDDESITTKCDLSTRTESPSETKAKDDYIFDEDDLELYGEEEMRETTNLPKAGEETQQEGADASQMAPSRYNTLGGYISGAALSESSKVVVAISRQSGHLEIYDVAKLFASFSESMVQALEDSEAKEAALLWSSDSGCGLGASILNSSKIPSRRPKVQESCAAEIRFFFSGPSNSSQSDESATTRDLSILRSLCLLVDTNQGDVHLYTGSKSYSSNAIAFKRVSLRTVARPSQEEGKHRNKLRRRGMTKDLDGIDSTFRPNRLHRFFSISGEDGLFAATSRPQWFLSERGAPSVLCHRLRHCAPAGGQEVPVAGFCSGFSLNSSGSDVGFITVHDRIGRVGSQRLTLFNG